MSLIRLNRVYRLKVQTTSVNDEYKFENRVNTLTTPGAIRRRGFYLNKNSTISLRRPVERFKLDTMICKVSAMQ